MRVMPVPSIIRAGCGLCLRLPMTEKRPAEVLLKKNSITPEQIYTKAIKNGENEFIILKGEDDGK